ncbi:hypothetical protein Tco_0563525 [Tanacetum coccineum]
MGSLQDHEVKLKKIRRKEPLMQALYSKVYFKERERSFHIKKTKDEDAVLFMAVVVSKARCFIHLKEGGNAASNQIVTIDEKLVINANELLSSKTSGIKILILWKDTMEKSKGNVTFRDESKAPVKEKGMLKGLDQIDHPNQVCEGWILGKHARSSFLKEETSRAKEPLQLIHTDLCGPITPPSHSMVEKEKGLKIKDDCGGGEHTGGGGYRCREAARSRVALSCRSQTHTHQKARSDDRWGGRWEGGSIDREVF